MRRSRRRFGSTTTSSTTATPTIDDGLLTIAFDGLGEIEPSETPVVELTVNSIDVIENHGDGDVTVAGVDADSLDVVNSDAGTVTVQRHCRRRGAQLDQQRLRRPHRARRPRRRVDDTDDGHVEVRATDTVEGEISGEADVVVHGDPAVTDVEVDDDAELAVA